MSCAPVHGKIGPWWVLAILFTICMLFSGCAIPERLFFITDKNLKLDKLPPALNVEEITFPSIDGKSLYGWYLAGAPGRPLVLFCHGNATNVSGEIHRLMLLQELGLSVFIFDYRGFGISEGAPSSTGTHRDALGALAFLENRGWTPQEMIYFGRSLGAAVALQLALERPAAGLILESPFTSLADLVRERHPRFGAFFPWALPNCYDNLAAIHRLESPLLIIHGDKDSVIPPRMAHQLFSHAPGPKLLYIVEDAGHANLSVPGEERYRLALSFFLFSYAGF